MRYKTIRVNGEISEKHEASMNGYAAEVVAFELRVSRTRGPHSGRSRQGLTRATCGMWRRIYWIRVTLRSKHTGKKSPAESKDSSGSINWRIDPLSVRLRPVFQTGLGHPKTRTGDNYEN